MTLICFSVQFALAVKSLHTHYFYYLVHHRVLGLRHRVLGVLLGCMMDVEDDLRSRRGPL